MSVLVNPNTGVAGKRASRSVNADGSQLLAVKWNQKQDFDEAGSEMATATVEQAVDGLIFQVNAADDTGISSYTGAATASKVTYGDTNADTIQKVLDVINGIGVGQPEPTETGYMTRWHAGLGDFRPGHIVDATTGLVAAALNVSLGNDPAGFVVNGDTSGLVVADKYFVGLGTDRSKSGGGQVYADHFESDYESDTSGNRFQVRNQGLRRENQPGLSEFRVAITSIFAGMVYGSGGKVVTIYDIDDNNLGSFPIAANTSVESISEETPFVGPAGSPLFVEVVGVGALTDGPLTVSGEVRIA